MKRYRAFILYLSFFGVIRKILQIGKYLERNIFVDWPGFLATLSNYYLGLKMTCLNEEPRVIIVLMSVSFRFASVIIRNLIIVLICCAVLCNKKCTDHRFTNCGFFFVLLLFNLWGGLSWPSSSLLRNIKRSI